MSFPGIRDPGAQLDLTVSLICGVFRLCWHETLVSGAVHVHPDGGYPIDGARVGDDSFVRGLIDVLVSKVLPVVGLVVDAEVGGPDEVGGQEQSVHSLVLGGLPHQSEVLPAGPHPGVHLEVAGLVHVDVPGPHTDSEVQGVVLAHRVRPGLHGDGEPVVASVLQQVVQQPAGSLVSSNKTEPATRYTRFA